MNARNFIKAFLLFLVPIPLMAAPKKTPSKTPTARTSGMFSDMEISRETGDVGGREMFFFHADKDYVLVIEAQGELQKPQLCEVVTNGASVQFSIRKAAGILGFRGTFGATHLTGKFSDGENLKIPRKKCRFLTTFSDLSFSRETGDAMGMEIISFLADARYVLILQGAGDLLAPVIVQAQSDGKSLGFTYKGLDGSLTSFKGTESKTFLSGVFSTAGRPGQPVKLPAKKSFWE
jgi:hypothetical protein